jgi:CMP-N,N'-diacetyllegionaminic acid synthase
VKILITLCARGGSKGIPGKNIKLLAGKPLISYTIGISKKFAGSHDVTIGLSTDDSEIRNVASDFGVNTNYIRPAYLASDTAGKIETITDLLAYEEQRLATKFDYVLDLDLTSPLRTLLDLEASMDIIVNNHEALNLFSVNPAARNPYFNMVEINDDGFYDLVKKSDDGTVMSRQKAPKVYDLNASFYWYKRSFFELGLKSPITERSLIYEMTHVCFDLDHPIDFEFLEFLIMNKKIDIL